MERSRWGHSQTLKAVTTRTRRVQHLSIARSQTHPLRRSRRAHLVQYRNSLSHLTRTSGYSINDDCPSIPLYSTGLGARPFQPWILNLASSSRPSHLRRSTALPPRRHLPPWILRLTNLHPTSLQWILLYRPSCTTAGVPAALVEDLHILLFFPMLLYHRRTRLLRKMPGERRGLFSIT